MFLALFGFVLRDRHFPPLPPPAPMVAASKPLVMAEILKIGSPIAMTEVAEMGMYFVTTLMMGLLGVEALAAQAVTAQCYAVRLHDPDRDRPGGAVRVGRAAGRAR